MFVVFYTLTYDGVQVLKRSASFADLHDAVRYVKNVGSGRAVVVDLAADDDSPESTLAAMARRGVF